MSIKIVDMAGLTHFWNCLKEKFVAKETGKGLSTNDYTSEEKTKVSQIDTVAMLAHESDFKSESIFHAMQEGFDYLCIEPFKDTEDIDKTVLDGASIVQYFIQDAHIINKTSSDTLTIQSKNFAISTTPYDAWVYADYDGSGSVELYFSKNSGSDWTQVPNDTMVSINSLVQKNIRIKVVLHGSVRLKNIAWGVK